MGTAPNPPLGETAHAPEELPRRSRPARLGGQPRPHGAQLVGHQGIDPAQRAETIEPSLDNGGIRGRVTPVEAEDEVVEVIGLKAARGRPIDMVEDPLLDLARGAGDR